MIYDTYYKKYFSYFNYDLIFDLSRIRKVLIFILINNKYFLMLQIINSQEKPQT